MKMNYYSESNYEIFHGTEHSAGIDLPFYDKDLTEITINPGESAVLKTGIHMEIPENHVGILDTRSSTSKLKLDLLARTIDCDFRGNIRVVFINNGTEPVTVYRGDYLAQIIILPYQRTTPIRVASVESLSETTRGGGGFGHTGNTSASEL